MGNKANGQMKKQTCEQSTEISQSDVVSTTADFQAKVNMKRTRTNANNCSETDVGQVSENPSRPKRCRRPSVKTNYMDAQYRSNLKSTRKQSSLPGGSTNGSKAANSLTVSGKNYS